MLLIVDFDRLNANPATIDHSGIRNSLRNRWNLRLRRSVFRMRISQKRNVPPRWGGTLRLPYTLCAPLPVNGYGFTRAQSWNS